MIRILPTLLLAALFASGCATTRSTGSTEGPPGDLRFDFGPIASRQQDVNGDWRLKVLGPFFEHAESPDNAKDMKAVRPFYSAFGDDTRDYYGTDYAWPVGVSRSIHDEGQWRFLIFYGFDHEGSQEDNRYRVWLIPFYFQSRTPDGKVHRAVFPFGGTITDFLIRDEISFVLWPVYTKSSVNDVVTTSVLWPLISHTTTPDDRIYRARFFPFYGVNKRPGKYTKRFVLWPFYTSTRYEYEKSSGGGHILFPLYGYMNLTTEKTVWVIPPFFRFTRGDERNIIHAPWPFYQRTTGPDVYKHYIWPLWGHRVTKDRERNFYLWPIFWTDKDKRPGSYSERFIAAPFWSHTAVRSEPPPGLAPENAPVLERRHKFWPLYSYSRKGDTSRFRFPELWPFAEARTVERNLSPLWSLYSRQQAGEAVDTEVLWGLYRSSRRADASSYRSLFPLFDYRRETQIDQPERKWNILKGLIGYENSGGERRLRLLYFIKIGIGKDD